MIACLTRRPWTIGDQRRGAWISSRTALRRWAEQFPLRRRGDRFDILCSRLAWRGCREPLLRGERHDHAHLLGVPFHPVKGSLGSLCANRDHRALGRTQRAATPALEVSRMRAGARTAAPLPACGDGGGGCPSARDAARASRPCSAPGGGPYRGVSAELRRQLEHGIQHSANLQSGSRASSTCQGSPRRDDRGRFQHDVQIILDIGKPLCRHDAPQRARARCWRPARRPPSLAALSDLRVGKPLNESFSCSSRGRR